jgi:hypothetical protein|tara:strand:- start:904 stop:1107 length:204 start_codon:yes stop_codon:yes gene_type:complete
MQSRHYRLGRSIDANRVLKDIELMIKEHAKLNNLDDTILSIEIKDISCTYDLNDKRIVDDRKNSLPE